jgi:hypothetical protein
MIVMLAMMAIVPAAGASEPSGAPCATVATIERAARETRPFFSLKGAAVVDAASPMAARRAKTTPLPGLDPCNLVFSHTVALACLGPVVPGGGAVDATGADSETRAVEAYANAIAPCLAAPYARRDDLAGASPVVTWSAGANAPLFQIGMIRSLENGLESRRPELLVIGPAPRSTPPAARPPAKAKTKARRRG